MKTLKKKIILVLMATALLCGILFTALMINPTGKAFADRGTAFEASASAAFNADVEDDYDFVSFDYKLTDTSTTLAIYITGSQKYGTLYYGVYNFLDTGVLNNGNPNNAIQISEVGDGYYHVTMEIAGLGRTGSSNNLDKKPEHIYTLRIHQSYTNGAGYIDNIGFSKNPRGEQFVVGTNKSIVAEEQNVNYDSVSFEYKLEQADSDHRLNICFLDSIGSKYYGYYNFRGDGTVGNDSTNAINVTPLEDGYYRVVINFADLVRTGNAENLTGKPSDVYQIYIHGNNSNSNAYIDNIEFSKNPRGEQFVVGTNKSIVAEEQNVNYDSVSFEYKLEQADSDHRLNICFLDSIGSKYYGYYNFRGDGTVGNDSTNAINVTPLEDGYYRVVINFADLVRTGNAENLTGKPSDVYQIYIHGNNSNSNAYIDNVEFTLNVEEIEYRGTLYSKDNDLNITSVSGEKSNKFSFDYCLLDNATVQFCILNDWDFYVNYFTLDQNGLVGTVEGITTKILSDGYVRVTIEKTGMEDITFRFYTLASKLNSDYYLDNLLFVSDNEDIFQMTTGASTRLALDGHYGIRFEANISESAFDAEAEYGMIIIPFDYIATYGLDGDYIAQLEEQSVAFRKFICTPIVTIDGYKIQASLTDIIESNINRKFIGIAYKKVDEIYTYVNFNESDNARCIKTVATKAVMDVEKFNAFNENEKAFLKTTANVVTNIDESSNIIVYSYATDINATRNQVIEFYYKKLTEGTVRFAVIGADWNNYYGYFSMENDYSLFNGVQVSPVGTDFEYVSGSDKINSLDQWYKVVIDIASLDKVNESEAGNVATQEYFNVIYFSGTTAKLELTGINVKDAVVADKAYSCYGNNSTTTYSYTFTETINYENISKLTYYVKAVSNVGGNVLKIQVKNLGEYVNVDTSSLTTNKAYATVETVDSGEYAGWLKVTYDFSLKDIESNITGFYTRYNEGEFLVGGFSAEYI